MKHGFSIILAICATVLGVSSALSCPVCFGANDSPMNAGMNAALLVMLGITGVVLSTIGAFFLMMWRRHRRSRVRISEVSSVNEEGILEVKSNKGVTEWNTY